MVRSMDAFHYGLHIQVIISHMFTTSLWACGTAIFNAIRYAAVLIILCCSRRLGAEP